MERTPLTQLRSVTCRMGSHSVTTYLPSDTSEHTPP